MGQKKRKKKKEKGSKNWYTPDFHSIVNLLIILISSVTNVRLHIKRKNWTVVASDKEKNIEGWDKKKEEDFWHRCFPYMRNVKISLKLNIILWLKRRGNLLYRDIILKCNSRKVGKHFFLPHRENKMRLLI